MQVQQVYMHRVFARSLAPRWHGSSMAQRVFSVWGSTITSLGYPYATVWNKNITKVPLLEKYSVQEYGVLVQLYLSTPAASQIKSQSASDAYVYKNLWEETGTKNRK